MLFRMVAKITKGDPMDRLLLLGGVLTLLYIFFKQYLLNSTKIVRLFLRKLRQNPDKNKFSVFSEFSWIKTLSVRA